MSEPLAASSAMSGELLAELLGIAAVILACGIAIAIAVIVDIRRTPATRRPTRDPATNGDIDALRRILHEPPSIPEPTPDAMDHLEQDFYRYLENQR